MAQPQGNARSYILPAPTGGWNTRDPLISMPETDAVQLENVIPGSNFCRARLGQYVHCDVGSGTVHTLATLALTSGSEKLVAVAGTDIYDATTSTASSIKGAATITSNVMWQHVTFRNRLFMVNGTNQPLDWTGTGNVNATAWTGSGLTITNLINVAAYKRRLYFVEKDTARIWYTEAVDNVSGALVSFDVSSLLAKGGNVLYAGSTSTTNALTPAAELFVIVSSQGEVLVYAGDNPLSSSWELIGHYTLGRAIGYRCAFPIGGDLHLITFDGVVPLSQLLNGISTDNDYQTLSGKIKPSFVEAATAYADNDSWCGCYYPNGAYALVNIPLSDFGNSQQFVFNTITKAWCKFVDVHAHSWTTLKGATNEKLLCGSKTDGKIYVVDDLVSLPQDDDGAAVFVTIQHAYSWLGQPNADKIVHFLQPYMFIGSNHPQTGGQSVSSGVFVDYEFANLSALPVTTYTVNDGTAPNAAINNKQILDITANGAQVSVSYKAALRNALTAFTNKGLHMRYYASRVFYSQGSEIA